jgi:predicted metal-binding protein
MSIKEDEIAVAVATDQQSGLKSYPAPWEGQVILVCRKCQKKIRHDGKKNKLGKLAKELKKRSREEGSGPRLHVIEVSCLKVCPKGGVTVCPPKQLARNEFSIVRSPADVNALLAS